MTLKNWRVAATIFVLSFCILLSEVAYTRIFSWKLYYYYSFFVLGLALFGLSIGSALILRFPELSRNYFKRTIVWSSLLAGLVIQAGYVIIVYVPTNTRRLPYSSFEFLKLFLLIGLVFLPFTLLGLAVANVLTNLPEEIHWIYFFDLLGAGVACLVAVYLINHLTPPGAIFLVGGLAALLGLVWSFSVASSDTVILALSVVAVVGGGGMLLDELPAPVSDKRSLSDRSRGLFKRLSESTAYTRWNAVFRVDVIDDFPGLEKKNIKGVLHEGLAGSALYPYRSPGQFRRMFKDDWTLSLPVKAAPSQPEVIVIGAAGGREVLASLAHGASRVTGVELNPVYREMLTGPFYEFTGGFVDHPRVDYRTGEGRSFLAGSNRVFDLIYFVSPDSYASRAVSQSGAFVLHESYLYTVEAIKDSLQRLSRDGVIAIQVPGYFRGRPYRAPRYLTSARRAYDQLDIEPFRDHVLVAYSPKGYLGSTLMILMKKEPFDPKTINDLRESAGLSSEAKLFYAENFPRDHPVFQPLLLDGTQLEEWINRYPYNVDPVYDNSPYFWNVVGFWDLVKRGFDLPAKGHRGRGERVLLVLLALGGSVGLALILGFFPPFARVDLSFMEKILISIYFALIGVGFMSFEVSLIQKFTLFLGYPTYSLTICLAIILISTGFGSLMSRRYSSTHWTIVVGGLLVLGASIMVVYGFPVLKDHWMGSSLPIKVIMTASLLAPLGVGMGVFLPAGIDWVTRSSEQSTEVVAWSWALNGYFSVLASNLASIVAMSYGFTTVQYGSMFLYACALGVMEVLIQGQ